jgi:hypothetical protein
MTVLIFANVYNQLTKNTFEYFSQRKALRIKDEIMGNTEKELI